MITTTQVVDTSATCNSLSKNYSHPDDHTRQTTDTLGFKPFTNSLSKEYSHPDDHTRQATDTLGFKSFTNSLSKDYSHPDDHTRQTTHSLLPLDTRVWTGHLFRSLQVSIAKRDHNLRPYGGPGVTAGFLFRGKMKVLGILTDVTISLKPEEVKDR